MESITWKIILHHFISSESFVLRGLRDELQEVTKAGIKQVAKLKPSIKLLA